MGWQGTERIFTGITTPTLDTVSGVTLRTTPEHTLWLATHTSGLTINTACPIDIPSLMTSHTISWVLLGDTGSQMHIVFKGEIPEKLKNFSSAFGCTITEEKGWFSLQENTTAIPARSPLFTLTTPGGWAWKENDHVPMTLAKNGINIALPQAQQEKMPWPEQHLTIALPVAQISYDALPETWQGLTEILKQGQGTAYFVWDAEKETESALSFAKDLTDDEITRLLYVVGNIPTTQEIAFREDSAKYFTTTKQAIELNWKSDNEATVQTADKSIIAYIIKKDGYTLVSTGPTEWTTITPHWQAPLNQTGYTHQHTNQTLADFGEKIFTTKNTLTVFQSEM